MVEILDIEQRTPEWYQARAGIPTASQFAKIISGTKLTKSASFKGYAMQKAAELRGHFEDSFSNDWMERGTMLEPQAITAYEFIMDVDVTPCGFMSIDDPRCGCSPDGLIGEDGGVQVKCPKLSSHLGYLHDGVLPAAYRSQVFGELFVSGRQWWDFISYHPDEEPLIVRTFRADIVDWVAKFEELCRKFNEMVAGV